MSKSQSIATRPISRITLEERDAIANLALEPQYDALNQLYNQIEGTFRGLKPIQPTWVHYNEIVSDDNTRVDYELLGMAKYQGKVRLCHATDCDRNFEGDVYDLKPIVECPIAVRVAAVAHVRRLHERIVKSKEDFIPKVDAAVKELQSVWNELQ